MGTDKFVAVTWMALDGRRLLSYLFWERVAEDRGRSTSGSPLGLRLMPPTGLGDPIESIERLAPRYAAGYRAWLEGKGRKGRRKQNATRVRTR